MSVKIYEYPRCSTCKNALKFLDKKKIEYKKIDITSQPPTPAELKKMLGFYDGEIRKLFNTSGQDYRALGLKDKIKDISEKEALSLLSKNGKLVKRPFVLTKKRGLVGFKEEEWKKFFEKLD